MRRNTLMFIKHLRLAAIVVLWTGLLFKTYILFILGAFIWAGSYLYTFSKIEERLFNEEKETKEEDWDPGTTD